MYTYAIIDTNEMTIASFAGVDTLVPQYVHDELIYIELRKDGHYVGNFWKSNNYKLVKNRIDTRTFETLERTDMWEYFTTNAQES